MSETSFDKTNFGGQLGHGQQGLQEWWELETAPNIPTVKLPSWFDSPSWAGVFHSLVGAAPRGCPHV
ncbi:hypothetical protein [Microcoleus sp. POL10_C6]|uniref:hypothetical protein n=1 Tax=unclassified Microcoleus TaxID=2642155 RepID=UPI002FD6D6AA